jgi:transcriptional regulator with XRE-family HTH domain
MSDKSFTNWVSSSDHSLALYIGTFVKHHRLEQNKTQDSLAYQAGISRSTLSMLERGESVTVATLIQVLRALNQLQVMEAFSVQKTISPLLLAKIEKKERTRASSSRKSLIIKDNQNQKESDW